MIESYPLRMPLPLHDRVAFARAGLKLQRAVRAYHEVANAQHVSAAKLRARVLAFEDDRTFAEFLGDLPPGPSRSSRAPPTARPRCPQAFVGH